MAKRNKLPSLRSLMEAEDSKFGDEISKINDWFSKEYDESHQFEWDGKTLKVLDGDEKEVTTISRDELAKKIEGFPGTTNEDEELDDDGNPIKPKPDDDDDDEDEDKLEDEAEEFVKENKLPKTKKSMERLLVNFYSQARKSRKK